MCSKESTGREYKCEKAVGLRLTCNSKAVSKGNKVRPRAMTEHKAVRRRHQNRVRPWPKEGLGRGPNNKIRVPKWH
jgi:hypothetical protein